MKTVRFLAPAESEMMDAAVYYERQARGLGIDFLDRIEEAAEDLARNPELWSVIQNNVRKRLVHRFPYALFFRDDPDEIVVLAVMHLRRRPNYWIDRT